jgi:hypothetical protein
VQWTFCNTAIKQQKEDYQSKIFVQTAFRKKSMEDEKCNVRLFKLSKTTKNAKAEKTKL